MIVELNDKESSISLQVGYQSIPFFLMKTINTLLAICLSVVAYSQSFEISKEFRSQAEYLKLVTLPGFDPIYLLRQRTRINVKPSFFTKIQDK